jgi:hypothetical protein
MLPAADMRVIDSAAHERHVWWVSAVTAAAGFCIGAFVYPMWTDNVESAQVQAQLVSYRPGDVMGVYHNAAYSLAIQIAAILLRAGVTEWTLSLLFSGAQAALSCAAIALATLAVSRSATTALLVPVLLLRFRVGLPDWPRFPLAAFHGHNYPNFFPNHTSFYGVLGLFWILLVLSLFSLRKVRTGAVLLGLMPAVHIGLAPACAVAVAGVGLFLRRSVQPWLGTLGRYGAIGLGVSAASAVGHWTAHWSGAATGSPSEVEQAAAAFARSWDDHSALLGDGSRLGFFESEFYTLILGGLLLAFGRRWLAPSAGVLVVGLLSTTAVGILYTVGANLWPDLIGWRLATLMVTRWLNLSSFAFPVFALALLGKLAFRQRDALAATALGTTAAVVLTGYAASISGAASEALAFNIGALRAYSFPLACVLPACVLALLRRRNDAALRYPLGLRPVACALALAACVLSLLVDQFARGDRRRIAGQDVFTPALERVRAGRGLLLIGDGLWEVGRVQLRTRRPLLIDPMQLNMLLKVPNAGPRMEYILRRAYRTEGFGHQRPSPLDQLLAEQTVEFWQSLRRDFGVSEVLVLSHVRLALPVVHGDPYLTLYRIPGELPQPSPTRSSS